MPRNTAKTGLGTEREEPGPPHFIDKIEALQQRLFELQQCAKQDVIDPEQVLPELVTELANSVEELRVAEAELRQQADALAAAHAEAEAGLARYRELFEFSPDSYVVTDAQGVIREANRAAGAMLELAPQVLLGKPLATFIPTKDRRAFRQELLKVLQLGARRDWELTMQPRRADPFPALITVATAPPSSSGEPPLLRWLIRDITEHKRLEAEQQRARMAEIVVNEVNHRLKNNLAIIAGLLQMQVQDEPEGSRAADTLRKAIARIMSVAAVHEQLYESGIEKVDVLELTRGVAWSLCQALGADGFEVWVHGDHCSYPPATAVSLALTVSELLTNAMKHGEPDTKGKKRAELTVAHRDDTLRLTLWNSGNPVAADFVPDGKGSMGLQLVHDIVVGQYGGAFSVSPREGGTCAEITLPDSRLR